MLICAAAEYNQEERSVLPSEADVYRALLKSKWIDPDTNAILPDAYLPRTNGRDDDGLSVTIADATTSDTLQEGARAFAASFQKTYGVALLNVGRVRKIDNCLDVVRDPHEGSPKHALLTGVPRPDQNIALAERLAGQLARISQNI